MNKFNMMFGVSFKIQEIYNSLSVAKKLVLWYTIATIIQKGILFLVTPLYTRLLTDLEYGVFSVYQSWQMLVSIITVLALDRCITVGFMKFANDRRGFLSAVQSLMTITVVLFALPVVIFASFFERLMGLSIHIIAVMFIVALMNNTFANWMWLQRYRYNYKKLAAVTILSTVIIQLISVYSVIYFPAANKGEILILSSALGGVLLYGILYVSVFVEGKEFYNSKYWTFALRYSVAVIPHALAQIILNSSDRIMIGKLCGRADAAYYSITYTAAMVINLVVLSLCLASQPWFFEKIKGHDFNSIKKKTNFILLFTASLVVLASLVAPEVLSILAPASYNAALQIFPSIATSVLFYSMYISFANFESYYEKPFYFSIATTIVAIVNIILNYIFIPMFGFVAAGYTTLLCYILFAVMHYMFMRKVCQEKLENIKVFDEKFIVGLSIITILLSFVITVTYQFQLIRYALILFVSIIVMTKRKVIVQQMKNLL